MLLLMVICNNVSISSAFLNAVGNRADTERTEAFKQALKLIKCVFMPSMLRVIHDSSNRDRNKTFNCILG